MQSIKKTLKPNIAKIILFIVTLGGVNYILISSFMIVDARVLVGFPFGFYPVGSFMPPPLGYGETPTVEFSIIPFIIDILFWYLISAFIIQIISKVIYIVKKKHLIINLNN